MQYVIYISQALYDTNLHDFHDGRGGNMNALKKTKIGIKWKPCPLATLLIHADQALPNSHQFWVVRIPFLVARDRHIRSHQEAYDHCDFLMAQHLSP